MRKMKKMLAVALAAIIALSVVIIAPVSAGAAVNESEGISSGYPSRVYHEYITLKVGEGKRLNAYYTYKNYYTAPSIHMSTNGVIKAQKLYDAVSITAISPGSASVDISATTYLPGVYSDAYATDHVYYHITVEAASGGSSGGGSSGGGSTSSAPIPGAPTINVVNSYESMNVYWNKVANAAEYRVYYKSTDTDWKIASAGCISERFSFFTTANIFRLPPVKNMPFRCVRSVRTERTAEPRIL